MKRIDFILKFGRITTLIISPFVILFLITPITNIPASINLWCIGIGTLVALVIANRLQNDFVVIRYKNKFVFLTEISTYLRKIGYEQVGAEEAKITYRGTLQTSLLASDVEVIMQAGKALIIAPKIYLKKLIKLLPVTNMYLVDKSVGNYPRKTLYKIRKLKGASSSKNTAPRI